MNRPIARAGSMAEMRCASSASWSTPRLWSIIQAMPSDRMPIASHRTSGSVAHRHHFVEHRHRRDTGRLRSTARCRRPAAGDDVRQSAVDNTAARSQVAAAAAHAPR